jgi:transglutaminase-like putative cysteine protease
VRFANAHKGATYLVVGFALLAMISGGGIQPVFALAMMIAFVGSWWWEPPRVKFERWTWVWTGASLLALAYSVLMAVAGGDYLGTGGQFLMWLAVAKAFNRKAARDWQQLYLLSFLMLVAGSVLNADLTYGLCFLGFVISSTWALTLFHLRREMEDNLLVKHAADRASERVEVRRILDSKRIVGARFFLGTGALSFGVFLGSAVVFLSLPRVGAGFFLKTRGGVSFAGFSDEGVKLGGHGVIKNDDTVVMRVEIDPKLGGIEAPEIHWRGVAYEKYEAGQWSRFPITTDTREAKVDAAQGHERHVFLVGSEPASQQAQQVEATAVKQEVWLEPIDSDVLFGGGRPRMFDYSASLVPRRQRTFQNDEYHLDHNGTIHYTVWSEMHPPSAEQLRAAVGPVPPAVSRDAELAPGTTNRTIELARSITAGRTNNFDKAAAIQSWLTNNLTYTLELEEPHAGQDPVDFFLFDRKMGHCEYFASAFAVLARAAHVPVRNVNGFLGGEWNEYEGYVAVRAGDAHSWDEVYFPQYGWVTFDPTPAGGEELSRGGGGPLARIERVLDTARFQWNKWVIEYDLASQVELFSDIGGGFKRAAVAVKEAASDAWETIRDNAIPVGAGVAAVIGLFVWRRRKRGGPRPMREGATRAIRRARTQIALAYDQVAKALAKSGSKRDPSTTPRELATMLASHPAAAQITELVELYYAAEWGGRADAATEARARQLATAIQTTLDGLARKRAA